MSTPWAPAREASSANATASPRALSCREPSMPRPPSSSSIIAMIGTAGASEPRSSRRPDRAPHSTPRLGSSIEVKDEVGVHRARRAGQADVGESVACRSASTVIGSPGHEACRHRDLQRAPAAGGACSDRLLRTRVGGQLLRLVVRPGLVALRAPSRVPDVERAVDLRRPGRRRRSAPKISSSAGRDHRHLHRERARARRAAGRAHAGHGRSPRTARPAPRRSR